MLRESGPTVTLPAARRVNGDTIDIRASKVNEKSSSLIKREIVWKNVIVYVIGHLIGFYGMKLWLFDITWTHTVTLYMTTYIINLNGILMGAHRYYAHRSFKASKAVQLLMVIAQTAASQNCLWVWVRDHRQHHKYSDTDGDPHNATNGFFFSHVGWLLSKKHPEVIAKGRAIDMSDLDADPFVVFQKRHYFKLWFPLAILLPSVIPAYVTGEPLMKCVAIWFFFRLILSLNFTWFVNSWAHLWGTKPFDKGIQPVETYFVSFVTGGEGWHNYHHTFPWDYKAAEFGSPLNVVSKYIRLWARLGLVWDLREASDDMVVTRSARTGDGSLIWTKLKHC